jgi:hypothetical protein
MAKETQADIADRIDRHGDRYHNAGDFRNEAEARDAASRKTTTAGESAGQPPIPRFGTPNGTSQPPASATAVSPGRQARRV